MTKKMDKASEERKDLASTFEAADSYLYAAIATARDGLEANNAPEDGKRFLVIEDLLEHYRKTIHAAIDGKAA